MNRLISQAQAQPGVFSLAFLSDKHTNEIYRAMSNEQALLKLTFLSF
ncbi:hypothetical protein VCHA43P277_40127 [Vibrio chagasii]|nr:hypothetical protein VCHA35O141_30076 [Vibrio chagasii]CAH6953471.1 hypothetical protein VCHA35O143_30165 [Vibrio chagasii]CAH6990511.1 hypothetical protein VCHA31O73_40079 [Vibrio chagasii]CAH7004413.1 hypothetical protein VCHA34P126_50128 [Vibrio chagasii]CAH7232276.1 hypothetical protein VCHA37P191_20311 [Vibrio chagasii]